MNTGVYPYSKSAALKALGFAEKPQPINSSGITNMIVDLVSDDSKVLAYVSYNHYGIIVTGIQIRQGDRGVYINYPNFLKDDGTRHSYFFPVNLAVAHIVERSIYEEFEKKRAELLDKLNWRLDQKRKPA